MSHFPEALRLVEKLNNEAGSRDSSVTRGALGGFHLEKSLLYKSSNRLLLLYIEDAAAEKRGPKQNAIFNGRVLYS